MTSISINDRSIDGVLGTRTRGGTMVGADESTELPMAVPPLLILSDQRMESKLKKTNSVRTRKTEKENKNEKWKE